MQIWTVLIVGSELYLEPTLNFRGRVLEHFPAQSICNGGNT